MSGEFLDELVASPNADFSRWTLKAPFRYRTADGFIITVPEGFETDFASIPRAFWNIYPPTGAYAPAAVVHDYLYYSALFERAKADEIFLEAMKVSGVWWLRRTIIYRAVRLFGWAAWNERRKEEDEEGIERDEHDS